MANMKKLPLYILKETVEVSEDYLPISTLKFLKDNPRVYACTHGHPGFEDLMEEEKQKLIFEKLQKERSVKKLRPDIERHGGLMEPILVRHDTNEVIEGNSRLAVYRLLYDKTKDDNWELIPCNIVSKLTDPQQAAYLNAIHVKGKTQWSAYEKANFAYVRKQGGWSFKDIADLFGESEGTIRTRIRVIETMKENSDSAQSHFSYYDVIVRTSAIRDAVSQHQELRHLLLTEIKKVGLNEEESEFTAQQLRKKLPVILDKPKVRKKYLRGEIGLDEGYQLANISDGEKQIRQARELLGNVSRKEVLTLEQSRFNAFKAEIRRVSQEVDRLNKITKDRETP